MGNSEEKEVQHSCAYGEFTTEIKKGQHVAVIEKVIEKTPFIKAELQFDL